MTTILESLSAIARKAENLLTELQGRRLDETLKGPGDLLTRADLASHAFLQSKLANCFPGLPLILEEQANPIIPDTACIVGDELDGTIPFARGIRDWGVLCLACGAAGFAELMLGRTSLYVNCKGGRIWDFAAGALAVEEAGGIVTRLNGAGIDWRCIDMDILCASSTAIAEEALRLTAG